LSSVAVAGPALVLSTRAGELFGLDVDTGYTLWGYRLGHHVTAEPIVAKGWVYTATTDGRVVALHVADPSLDGWHMFGGNARHNGT
jgi:outer membrane protein assembly factor BamB